jgi:hypothetical protein
MRQMPSLRFVPRPKDLPAAPETGRLALVDLAFAHGDDFERVTRPLIDRLGPRLALWVDHHDHEAWSEYREDPRFILVPKTTARACPELIEPEVVARAGTVDFVWAHADFDGCVAAAKFLNGGVSPYPEADEDARWADAPGQGFSISTRGYRLAAALDEGSTSLKTERYLRLLQQVAESLVRGHESTELSTQLDRLVEGRDHRQARLRETYLDDLTRPHPEILVLDVDGNIERSDKKFLLREMELRARVAVVNEKGHVTAATFDDDEATGLDLRTVPGLRGQRGFAWGRVDVDRVVEALAPRLGRG